MEKKTKIQIKYSILILIFLIGLTSGRSLLLSPPYDKYTYEPGKIYSWSFNVGGLKEANQTQLFEVYPSNELNQSLIIFSNKTLTLTPNAWVSVYGQFKVPNDLKPGSHKAGITVVSKPSKESQQGLSALVGIEYIIYVDVPYPGKYLEASLDVQNVNKGDTVKFMTSLTGKGIEKINFANIKLIVYDSNNKNIYEINDNVENINPSDAIKKTFEWNTKINPDGIYKVVMEINYDTDKIILEKNFRIGDLVIKIVNITGTNIYKGDTGKIVVIGESQYNSFIDQAYATIEFNSGDSLLQLKSSSYGFDPFTRNNFEIFLDTSNIKIGEYNATAKIIYANKTEQKEFKINVKNKLLSIIFSIQTILIFIIVILILIILFILIKRDKNKKNEIK